MGDDIILSERLLLYLASDDEQRLLPGQHQQEPAQRDAAALRGRRELG